MDLLSQLKQHFGFDAFRGEQGAVIGSLLEGESALAIMPTGFGKSLCYQMPAVLKPGTCIVLSPLIALMQDQVRAARQFNISCDFINSTLSAEERTRRYKKLNRGEYKLIFVTPERFRKSEFLEALRGVQISLLAVDEAHCISQWGHDFRPDYSRVGEFRKLLGEPVTLALTATATPQVQGDILKQLNMPTAQKFLGGIERANLALRVHAVHGIDEKIRNIIGLRHSILGSMIVYSSLISTLEKISFELKKLGLNHHKYHGQMAPPQRHGAQKHFMESTSDLMLATPAFGLGVDKRDIRAIVHVEMPGSIEAYYQEIGRAGRDGLISEAHLFLDQDDVSIQMDFIKWANPDPGFVKEVLRLIKNNSMRYMQEGNDFLRGQMNFYNSRDFRVETALNQLERLGCLVASSAKDRFEYVREVEPDELDWQTHEEHLKAQNQKLLEILRWAQADTGCRMLKIYQYFGVSVEKPCGHCDLCVAHQQIGGGLDET